MARRIRLFIGMIMLVFAAWLFALSGEDYFNSRPHTVCGKKVALITKIFLVYHVGYAATFMNSRHLVMQIFINMKTGNWVIVGFPTDSAVDNACILDEGTGYLPILN